MTLEAVCEALAPTPVTPDEFNASPAGVRKALAQDASAWMEICT